MENLIIPIVSAILSFLAAYISSRINKHKVDAEVNKMNDERFQSLADFYKGEITYLKDVVNQLRDKIINLEEANIYANRFVCFNEGCKDRKKIIENGNTCKKNC